MARYLDHCVVEKQRWDVRGYGRIYCDAGGHGHGHGHGII